MGQEVQIDLTVLKNNIGALVLIAGVLSTGIAFAYEFYDLKEDFYASECKGLIAEWVVLMQTKEQYRGQDLPAWLVTAISVNATQRTKFNCST